MPNRYKVGLKPGRDTVVVLNINGHDIEMSYDTANKLAVMLRGYGKQAKRNAGDLVVKTIGFGLLTDAAAEEHKLQKRKDTTAHFIKSP